MAWKLEANKDEGLVKVLWLDKQNKVVRHPSLWDFVILDCESWQSITYATYDKDGYSAKIAEVHQKVCGSKTQFAEGNEAFAKEGSPEAAAAGYHILLHSRMLKAFGIDQSKMEKGTVWYYHDHWAHPEFNIFELIMLGAQHDFVDPKLAKELYKLKMDFPDLKF